MRALVARWLVWLRCRSCDAPPALRMDFLVKRTGPGQAEVNTLELTELGFSMLGCVGTACACACALHVCTLHVHHMPTACALQHVCIDTLPAHCILTASACATRMHALIDRAPHLPHLPRASAAGGPTARSSSLARCSRAASTTSAPPRRRRSGYASSAATCTCNPPTLPFRALPLRPTSMLTMRTCERSDGRRRPEFVAS